MQTPFEQSHQKESDVINQNAMLLTKNDNRLITDLHHATVKKSSANYNNINRGGVVGGYEGR